jgi:hypothetical protein
MRTGGAAGSYDQAKGGDRMTFSRKTIWISGALALVVLAVVLLVVYSGGGGGGGGY